MHNIHTSENSMFFSPFTAIEVIAEIGGMRNKNSNEDIPISFLKLMPAKFGDLLAEMFNMCFESGYYPDSLKIARVIPVHKGGSRELINNYRPISLLPSLNKIFERLIYKRIVNFLNSNNLLSDSQFGFRCHRNTEQACLKLITSIISKNTKSACLFIDFRKAFDTIDCGILLDKLSRFGIRGKSLELLKSYLTNRKCYVSFHECSSSVLDISLGVPQGSILGPLLFLMYINDIENLIDAENIVMFADDVAVLFYDNDIDLLHVKISYFLYKLSDWCNFFKLSLNVNKTKLMLFNVKRALFSDIVVNNDLIEIVNSYRYLGFMIDNRLSHKYHVKHLQSKLSRLVKLTKRLSVYFTKSTALCFYNSMVKSHLSYGLLVWGGIVAASAFNRLEGLQVQIIRNLFSRHVCDGSMLLSSCNILLLSKMYFVKACSLIYKLKKGDNLSYISLNLDELTSKHGYKTRFRDNFRLPYPHYRSTVVNLAYRSLKCWNSLPYEIRDLNTQFYRQLLGFVWNDNHLPERP